MKKIKPIFTEIMVIVHGKSEYEMCSFIKSNLKIKLEIVSENKGKNSIQINSLKNILGNTIFKSKRNFFKKYIDINKDNKNNPINFKLFTIMDTDDCTEETFENYKNKTMFKNHWLYEYIIPIYNKNCLEDVLKKSGVPYENKNKRNYINIFPTNRGQADIEQIQDFNNKIKSAINISNLNLFIEECLKIQKKYNNF